MKTVIDISAGIKIVDNVKDLMLELDKMTTDPAVIRKVKTRHKLNKKSIQYRKDNKKIIKQDNKFF